MGNKPSTKEINKILFDDDLEKPDIYSFISKKGNGKLVELAILANRTKDFSRLDDFIKNDCQKFLINCGKGENVKFIIFFLFFNIYFKKISIEEINNLRFKYEIIPTKPKSKWDLFCKEKKMKGI